VVEYLPHNSLSSIPSITHIHRKKEGERERERESEREEGRKAGERNSRTKILTLYFLQ
jgi:hypothetical protein